MYIIDSKRTPIGKFLGSLAHLSAPQLIQPLFEYFLATYPFLKTKTDEVILGNVLQAGSGMNPARLAAVRAGLAVSVPAYTSNHVCASGMNALVQGFRAVRAGDAELVLAGGMESMSQAPHLLMGARTGFKFGTHDLLDSLEHDGLWCGLAGESMGATAERLAQKYGITRAEQDRFALESHQKILAAQEKKVFKSDVIAVAELRVDEGPRPDTSLRKLASLRPAFKVDGTVTAGNSSSINDGAALLLLASEKAVQKYSLKPRAKVVDAVFIGLEPKLMGLGAATATEKLLKKNNLSEKDIDLFEINEAFAVQVLAVMQILQVKSSKVNIYGGALALGHPLGMSGARVVGSLVTALEKTGGKLGVATVCVGGGQGAALLIESIK